jgi:hypothetical protein
MRGHSIIPKLLEFLVLVWAISTGHELLTRPLANADIWSYRPFLIFTVEFELALASGSSPACTKSPPGSPRRAKEPGENRHRVLILS